MNRAAPEEGNDASAFSFPVLFKILNLFSELCQSAFYFNDQL
jgi:hypothetical protein